jgi:hypothetical protein
MANVSSGFIYDIVRLLVASLKFERPLTFQLLLILAEEEVSDKLAVAELPNTAEP